MKKAIASVIVIAFAIVAKAQGCSDAGFCSVGNLSHPSSANKQLSKHYLKITLPAGVGDDDVFVFTPGLEYGYTLKRWQFSGKVTGNHASENLGNATGPGDVFLSATYQLPATRKWQTSFTLGAKLPLNQANLKADGLSLPLQYQSSLGTVDLIAGIAVSRDKWRAAAGLQQPLTGINRNNFLPQYWGNGKANAYPPTNDFNRKGDVLLRVSYRVLQSKKLSFDGGLLGIYHLRDDTYIDANVSNKPISIKGSQGLTLNATGFIELTLNQHWSLGLMGGVPLVVRDVRPDGLTRSFVIAPQLSYQF
jgi:hypothetical protein